VNAMVVAAGVPPATSRRGCRARSRYHSQALPQPEHPSALGGTCRVDPGGYPPGPPTDPDVQNSRIRLFRRMGSLRDGRSSG